MIYNKIKLATKIVFMQENFEAKVLKINNFFMLTLILTKNL
jgi:hypothetical protein